MGVCLTLLLFLASLSSVWSQVVEDVSTVVNGTEAIAYTDDNYVCATLDWWPPEKCNYNQCPWANSSILNLDLDHPVLNNAIRAFKNLRVRIGGSLQDRVLYDVGDLKDQCHSFRKMSNGLFGFTRGCLHMNRWDEINSFLSKNGALVIFGLNALHGRRKAKGDVWVGDWDSKNANDFINYTVSKGYKIEAWEFGNELCGEGIGASVGAQQYGKDSIKLRSIIKDVYKGINPKPLLLAPGGFYDKPWYDKFLQISGPRVVDAVTIHLYNLGPGDDPSLTSKILDPSHLNRVTETYSSVRQSIISTGPWASTWVGESGGAFNSGGRNVSNTFVNSFWYLDQLGMAATFHTKAYCRQTLIGGNYALVDTDTVVPNPDYYSALLWHRLMGRQVLAVSTVTPPSLRTYAHCSKGRAGITLLVINLSNQTEYRINAHNSINANLQWEKPKHNVENSFVHGIKKAVSSIGTKASDGKNSREEYHLAPKDGDLHSNEMLLNGKLLQLTSLGDIPSLEPVLVDVVSPLSIPPLSIKFVVFPDFDARVCG